MQKKRCNSHTKRPKMPRQILPDIHNEILLYHKTTLKLQHLHQQLQQLLQTKQLCLMRHQDVRSAILRISYLVSQKQQLQQIILVYSSQCEQQHRLSTAIRQLEGEITQLSKKAQQIEMKNRNYSQWKSRQMNSYQILMNEHKINNLRMKLFQAECQIDGQSNGRKLRSILCQYISMVCRRKGLKYEDKQPIEIWLTLNNLTSEVSEYLKDPKMEEYLCHLNMLNILVHRYVEPEPEKQDDREIRMRISSLTDNLNIAKSELAVLHTQQKEARIRNEMRQNRLNDKQVRRRVGEIHEQQQKRMHYIRNTQQRIDSIRDMLGQIETEDSQWRQEDRLQKVKKEVKMYEKSLKQVRDYLMNYLKKYKPAAEGNFNQWLDELIEEHLERKQRSLSNLHNSTGSRQSSRDGTPMCRTVKLQPTHQYSNTFSNEKENSQPMATRNTNLKLLINRQKQERDRETVARQCLQSAARMSEYALLLPMNSPLQCSQSLQSTARRSQQKKKSAVK